LWENNPQAYMAQYLDGKKRGINRGMALGKIMADSLETGEETGIPEHDVVIWQIPQYHIRDKEILIKIKGYDVPILIKPDSTKIDYKAFYEYKQGDINTPWTQKKVDKDDQMLFYTTGLYIKNEGYIPQGDLIWAVTEKRIDDDGVERPHFTGEIRKFPYKAKMLDILKMQSRMVKAWRQIGWMMDKELL
jgi:hypothetical protein